MPSAATKLSLLMASVVGTAVTIFYTWSDPVVSYSLKGLPITAKGFYFEGKSDDDVMASTLRVKYEPGKEFYFELYYTENIDKGALARGWSAPGKLPDGSPTTLASAMLPGPDYNDATKAKPLYNVLTTIVPLGGASLNKMNWFIDFAHDQLAWYCVQSPVPTNSATADGVMNAHFKFPGTSPCDKDNGWEKFIVFDNDTQFFNFNIVKNYTAPGQPIIQLENFYMTQWSNNPLDFKPFYQDPTHTAYRTGPRVTITNPSTGATQLWTKDPALCTGEGSFDGTSDTVDDPIDASELDESFELQGTDFAVDATIHKTDCRSWASILGFYSHLVVYYAWNLPLNANQFCKTGTTPGNPGSVFANGEDFICSPSQLSDNHFAGSWDRALVCVHKKPCPGSSTDPKTAIYSQIPAFTPTSCTAPSAILYDGELLSDNAGTSMPSIAWDPTQCADIPNAVFGGSQWAKQTCVAPAGTVALDHEAELQTDSTWDDSTFLKYCGDRYIFFSGSDDWFDWVWNDILGAFLPWPHYGSVWSSGMFSDFAQWKHLVSRYMRPNGPYKTTFSGHSLGGGIASIAATYAKKQDSTINAQIATFGSPNAAFMPVIWLKYLVKFLLLPIIPAVELPGLSSWATNLVSTIVSKLDGVFGPQISSLIVTKVNDKITDTIASSSVNAVDTVSNSFIDKLMSIVPVGRPFQDIPNKRYTNKSKGCVLPGMRDPIPLSTKPLGYLPGPSLLDLYNTRKKKLTFSIGFKASFPWIKISIGCTPWEYNTDDQKTMPIVGDVLGILLHTGGKYSTFANKARAQQGLVW